MVKEINLDLPELLGKSETVTSPGASVQLPHNATSASVALVVDGKCEQGSTTGKNLAEFQPDLNTDAGQYSYVHNDAGYIEAIKLSSDGKFFAVFMANIVEGNTYVFSRQAAVNSSQVYLYLDTIWGTGADTVGMPIFLNLNYAKTFTATYTGTLILGLYSTTDIDNTVSVIGFQLELGSTATTYEPYTGGIPSPNPSYSQPINAIEELTLRVSGKNLLDTAALTTPNTTNAYYYYRDTAGFMFVAGKTYTLSTSDGSNASGLYIHKKVDNSDLKFVYGESSLTYTAVENVAVWFDGYWAASIGGRAGRELQLELGSTATAYEPPTGYTEVPLPLNGEFIGSLPDGTHDELSVDAAGDAVLVKRCGKGVFDGSADEAWVELPTNIDGKKRYYTPLPSSIDVVDTTHNYGAAICDRLLNLSTGGTWIRLTGFTISKPDDIHIRLHVYTDGSSLIDFKAFLAANPVTVYYKLAEPYTVHLDYSLPPVEGGEEMSVDTSLPTEIVWRYERMLWLPFEEIALTLPDAVEEIALVLDE